MLTSGYGFIGAGRPGRPASRRCIEEEQVTIGELIEALGGRLVQGDSDLRLQHVNAPDLAVPSDIVFAEDATGAAAALKCDAGVVVVRAGWLKEYPADKNVVEVENPRLWFARAA